MGGIVVLAIPALYLMGALATTMTPLVSSRLSRFDAQGRVPDEAYVARLAATCISVLGLACSLLAWARPTMVLFGDPMSARWGFYVDALSGSLLAGCGAVCLLAVTAHRGRSGDLAPVLCLACAASLIILAQNVWMLALALELMVPVAAWVMLRGREEGEGWAPGVAGALAIQVGVLMAFVALRSLARLDAVGRGGVDLPPVTLEDLRPAVAFAGPGALGPVLILVVAGTLLGMLVPTAPLTGAPPLPSLRPGARVALGGLLLVAWVAPLARIGFHVLPFGYWQNRPSSIPFCSAGLIALSVIWVSRPGTARARAVRGLTADVALLGLLLSTARDVDAGRMVALALMLAVSRAGLLALGDSSGADRPSIAEAVAHGARALSVAYAVASLASANLLYALFAALALAVPVWHIASALRGAPQREPERAASGVAYAALAAVLIALLWAGPFGGAQSLTESFNLGRTFIGPLGPD